MSGQSEDNKTVKWRCPKCGSVSEIGQVRCGKCGADLLLMGKLVYVNDSGGVIGEVTSKDTAGMDIPFVDIENDSDSDSASVPPDMSGKKENTGNNPEDDPVRPEAQKASEEKNPSHGQDFVQPNKKKKQKTKDPAYSGGVAPVEKNKPKKRKNFWIIAGCILAVLIVGAGIIAWNLVLPKIRLGNGTGTQETTPAPTRSAEATPAPTRSAEVTPAPTQKTNWKNNLLKPDVIDPASEGGKVFGSEINREEINRVEILSTLDDAPKDAWDVSAAGDGCVLAWTEKKDDYYTLYIAGEGGVNASQACATLFMNYKNLQEIAFNGAFITDGCTDMSCMFANCSSLGILQLNDFNTSSTKYFDSMFYGCTYLYTLDVSSFYTKYATTFRQMFCNCKNLTYINVGGFETENVTDMSYMFYGCSSLTDVDVSGFKTENVTTMKGMFHDCTNLKRADVGRFNTSGVTTMECMFNGCSSLTDVDVSGFDTVNVTNLSHMFCNCTNLEKVDVSRWDTFNVTDMSYMFYGCGNLSMTNDYISIPANANKEGILEGTKYTLKD